ncbi:MAG: 2-dehydropantoate 2-reductase [Acidiferrobacterales bacterium]|nr:2-dehydropantoate 2-reductase [Acidiferrobacterales bacterium]
MKIGILGAGAMGSVYAGLLREGGNEVHVVDVWQEHINAITKHGLRVEGASGNRTVHSIQAHTNAESVGICELIIIATKASNVGEAAAAAVSLADANTLVLTIQNGLGAGERILNAVDRGSPLANNILLGVAGGFGASLKAPGHVHHNGMELIRVGEMHGGLSDRVENIASIWRNAGFNVRAFEDIHQLIWEKFICNVTFSAPCTVFEKTLGELMAQKDAWSIAKGCALEAYQVAVAKRINLGFDDPERYVSDFGEKMPDARPSMYLDHLDRKPSEIDAINGIVPIVAEEVGLSAPINQTLSAIVKSREQLF